MPDRSNFLMLIEEKIEEKGALMGELEVSIGGIGLNLVVKTIDVAAGLMEWWS